MVEHVTVTIDPEAIRQRNDAAHQMVSDLCHQRREWMMSIPARRDYDPDLVIGASLRDVWKLLLAYESLKEQLAAAETRADCDDMVAADALLQEPEYQQLQRELAAVETRERTLRIGCQAALVDWRAELFSTEQPVASGQEVNRGAAMAYRRVIGLLQKVVDGTVTDLDFDEAEYADMLATS